MNIQSPSRRHFLQASGALVVAFSFQSDFAAAQAKPARLPGSLATNPGLDAWIRIGADGRVTIFTGKIEHHPGAPGEDDAMDVAFVFDGKLEVVERILRRGGDAQAQHPAVRRPELYLALMVAALRPGGRHRPAPSDLALTPAASR